MERAQYPLTGMILAERSGEVEIVGSPVASIIASVKELDGKIGQIGKENGEHFDTGDDRKFFGSRVASMFTGRYPFYLVKIGQKYHGKSGFFSPTNPGWCFSTPLKNMTSSNGMTIPFPIFSWKVMFSSHVPVPTNQTVILKN